MERPEPGKLWKKTASRAAMAPPNIVTGAVSMAASAALANPLPLILWGLGAVSWVLYATTSEKQLRKTIDEDRKLAEAKTESDRDALRLSIESALTLPPFGDWIRRGLLPDYGAQYRRLVDVRRTISRLARERSEINEVTELGLERQLDYMLTAFLQFVKARIAFLRIVASTRTEAAPPPRIPPKVRVTRGNVPTRGRVEYDEDDRPLETSLPGYEQRLADLDVKIEHLEERAAKEPASAAARKWHIDILKKQKELLKETGERDQSVAAQLEAFPAAFEVILGRISASQVDAGDVSATMGDIVERVEETERFVKAYAPAMDQMLTRLEMPG